MPANPLRTCHCFAARQAARHVTRIYDRHLGDVGLTSTQFSILVVIGSGDEVTMRVLADTLVMDRTTLLRALKPLQQQALVASFRAAADPRQQVFMLSPAGRQRVKRAAPRWQDAQLEFERSLGKARTRALRSRLLDMTRGVSG